MSGNLASSTKGETSKPTSKTGYDRIDINKLFKVGGYRVEVLFVMFGLYSFLFFLCSQGKATEPVAKTVAQKHGM